MAPNTNTSPKRPTGLPQYSVREGWAPTLVLALAWLTLAWAAAACVKAQPPTDTGNPVGPSSTPNPSPTTSGPLAYNQDMKPIFDSDCVSCHNSFRASAGYSMSTYQDVMRAVVPGNPNSALVVTTQPGGSMYPFFSGNPATRAAMVRSWVVDNKAAENR